MIIKRHVFMEFFFFYKKKLIHKYCFTRERIKKAEEELPKTPVEI